MDDTDFEYVIVGAGSAGCVLANRLTEDPHTRVLLLEAGPVDDRTEIRIPAAFSALFQSPVDWAYRTAPQAALGNRQVFFPRGKTLGGTSSINAQIYVRGNRVDYDGWAAAGNVGWSFADVLPYFRRSEDNSRGASPFHGVGGPLGVCDQRDPSPLSRAFVRAAIQVGIPANDDCNGPEQTGVGLVQVNQRRGARCSAADAFLRPALRRANLTLVTGAHASRILFDGRRATGVEYRLAGEMRRARARREVLLSGGAINSPQLLMLSGIGPAEHLRDFGIPVVQQLPGVGQHLQDHFAGGLFLRASRPITLLSARSKANLARYLLLRKGMLTSNVGEAIAFVHSQPGLAAPDLELIFAPVLFAAEGLVPPSEHGLTLAAIPLQPASLGEVRLHSADPYAPPSIDPRYLSDADGTDLKAILAGIRLARRIAQADPLRRYVADELVPGAQAHSDADLEATVRAQAQTLYHPVGTCRMGIDALAVVDPALRVHGVEGLRVIDASVMPNLIRGHTNAPTMMIAERAADLLRGRARQVGTAEPGVASPIAPG